MRPPSRAFRPALAALAPALLAGPLLAGALLAGTPGAGRAQMLALPVVQSPFPGRPLAVAVDAGGGGDGLRTLGLALAVRRGGSRLTGTVGAGAVQGFATTRPSFGLRVAYAQPIGTGGLAVAPFVGFGAVTRGDLARQLERSAADGRPPLRGSLAVIPAGVGLGYRRTLAGRAVAVHLTPQAQHWRRAAADDADEAVSRTYLRVGVGADVALTRTLGLTLAGEFGASSTVTGTGTAGRGLAEGPRATLVGVAVSYAPARRRQP